MRTTFWRSARRHRIGRAHALHVMGTTVGVPTLSKRGEHAISWIGPDDRGVDLEILALVVPDGLVVIHVMPHTFRRSPS